MTGRQTAGGRAFACHHFTTRCRRKGVRQRQLSQLCPAMHSVSSASPLPLDSYLPPFPYVAYNHCQRYSFIHSCTTSRLHPPFSSARRIVRARRALLARRLLWWPFVATPVFTHLHLHLHFASIISMPRLMLKALWHQQQQQQQRGVETAAAKSVAYFAAHLVKLFICPNPLTLLFLSHSLVYVSLPLVCLSVCSQSIKSAAPMFN